MPLVFDFTPDDLLIFIECTLYFIISSPPRLHFELNACLQSINLLIQQLFGGFLLLIYLWCIINDLVDQLQMLLVFLLPGPSDLCEGIVEVVLEFAQVLELTDVVSDLLLVGTFEFSPIYTLKNPRKALTYYYV